MKLKDLLYYVEDDYELRTCEDEPIKEYSSTELRYLPINDIMVENGKLVIHLNCDEEDIRFELGY